MASIEREVENALLNVVSGITGVNFFTSERGTARTMPSVTVQASISGEELVPFSGVFKTPASITYVARADTTARADFDGKFYDILEQLYRSPDLASYLTDNSNIKFYVAKVTGDSPAVIGQNRTWSRAMTLDITATAKFFPSNLSGLSLWLKSDAGVTLNGSNVIAWADQSGNGFNANGNVVNGVNPTFVSNVKNGKPILRFGNSNSATVLRTNATTFGNSGEFTIFTVYQYNETDNNWAELISKRDLATAEGSQFSISPRFISSDPTTSAFGVMGSDYNWSFLYQEPASTNWSIVCGTQSITNNSQKYFVNGSLASESASVASINQTNIAIGIGNGGDGVTPLSASSGGFKGDLAEVIFYNRALTTPERQQVEAYLNTKYAIY